MLLGGIFAAAPSHIFKMYKIKRFFLSLNPRRVLSTFLNFDILEPRLPKRQECMYLKLFSMFFFKKKCAHT